MATCVTLNADGTLTPTGQPVDQCTGYVLVSGSEYGVYSTVQQALAVPGTSETVGWFIGAWGAVMVFYIGARCVGAILSMFNDNH